MIRVLEEEFGFRTFHLENNVPEIPRNSAQVRMLGTLSCMLNLGSVGALQSVHFNLFRFSFLLVPAGLQPGWISISCVVNGR